MTMQDILSFMVPGEAYTFEDVCYNLEKTGYRVTSNDTVRDNLRKLQQKGEVVAVSGFYIRMVGEDTDYRLEDIGVINEILSVMHPDQTYDLRSIKGLRATAGFISLPRSVLKVYLEIMAGYGLVEEVDNDSYKRL